MSQWAVARSQWSVSGDTGNGWEFLTEAVVARAGKGSFDFADGSLREPSASLRMTGFGNLVSCMLGAFRLVLDILYFFNLYFRDAVAVHIFHSVAVAFVFERFAEVRDALQAGQHESGEGFESGVAGK